MKNDIYKLLNHVETDFTEYEEASDRSDISVAKLKKQLLTKRRRKRISRNLAAAACLGLLVAGLGLGPLKSEVNAAVKMLSYKIADALGIKEDLTPYEHVINKSITQGDITITLQEVILEKNNLIVSVLEEFPPELASEGSMTFNSDCYSVSDGRVVRPIGTSGSSIDLEPGKRGSVYEYDMIDFDASETIDINLDFISSIDPNKHFIFSFQADSSKISADTKEKALDHAFKLPDKSSITLTDLTVSPAGHKIYYTQTYDDPAVDTDIKYDMTLEGTDNLGNTIYFELSRSTKEDGCFKLSTLLSELSPEATSLTLTPYAVAFPEESGQLSNDFKKTGEAFTITLP